jgi:hypothetical protein
MQRKGKNNQNLNVGIRKQTPLGVASQAAPLFIVVGSTQGFFLQLV